MASKFTTGLVGLAVEAKPREKLKVLYTGILESLAAMPNTAAYRKYTEKIVKERLHHVDKTTDIKQLELAINDGQVEEVIEQAKRELKLARQMNKWKPWEPLVEQPPEGQWTWP